MKQPRGGYINPKQLNVREFTAGRELHDVKENVSAGISGMAVDYLTRFLSGTPVEKAFFVSFAGAKRLHQEDYAQALAKQIQGLDDTSITSACRLVNYDAVFRAGVGMPGSPYLLPKPESIMPDRFTCDNIKTMTERSMAFFDEYGPIVVDGMTFAGGYTETVSAGDGDFMTSGALWDFKTNKTKPTNKHTLQVLMYWLMGLHSFESSHYVDVEQLGFFQSASWRSEYGCREDARRGNAA